MNLFLVVVFGLLAAFALRAVFPSARVLPVPVASALGIGGALMGLAAFALTGGNARDDLFRTGGVGLFWTVAGAVIVVLAGSALWRVGSRARR